MEKKITCPVKGCLANLHYEENPENSRIMGATACSLLEGEVDCEQDCVRLMNIRRGGQDKPHNDAAT